MLFKENQIVLILKGRYTGKKAFVVKSTEKGVLVAIITPQKRRAPLKVNVRLMNEKHLIVTRYEANIQLESIEDKKTQEKNIQNMLVKMAEEGKNEWLVSKLKF
ncbi:hypothetical protein BDAP_002760 [Binucleata daphniae]